MNKWWANSMYRRREPERCAVSSAINETPKRVQFLFYVTTMMLMTYAYIFWLLSQWANPCFFCPVLHNWQRKGVNEREVRKLYTNCCWFMNVRLGQVEENWSGSNTFDSTWAKLVRYFSLNPSGWIMRRHQTICANEMKGKYLVRTTIYTCRLSRYAGSPPTSALVLIQWHRRQCGCEIHIASMTWRARKSCCIANKHSTKGQTPTNVLHRPFAE